MKIAITGSSGFVGNFLSNKISELLSIKQIHCIKYLKNQGICYMETLTRGEVKKN